AGSNISTTRIKISKLMEARWIRECETGGDFRRGADRILEHFTHYERVLVLRAVTSTSPFPVVSYSLWEIPLALLKRIETLTPEDFTPKRESGTTTAKVLDEVGAVAFSLRLDGSVEKVTVEHLPLSRCRRHASWAVETLLGKSEEE